MSKYKSVIIYNDDTVAIKQQDLGTQIEMSVLGVVAPSDRGGFLSKGIISIVPRTTTDSSLKPDKVLVTWNYGGVKLLPLERVKDHAVCIFETVEARNIWWSFVDAPHGDDEVTHVEVDIERSEQMVREVSGILKDIDDKENS